MSLNIVEGCRTLVQICADLKSHQSALIVSDESTEEVGAALLQQARLITPRLEHVVIPALTMHGQEPPPEVAVRMLGSDVIFGLTAMSMAHSQARLAASTAGARYLSLPDYSMDVLASRALQADFRALTELSIRLADRLTRGREIRLTTALGTDLHCGIAGRTANSAPGWCSAAGTMASPPDAEVNIAVCEDQTHGLVVVDGSIPCPQFGLLSQALSLHVENGAATRVSGPGAEKLEQLFDRNSEPKTRVVAEFGLGLNPLAQLCGRMLEDEGCRGTVHLGLGSNATIGGLNRVPFHLDFVIRRPTVTVDGYVLVRDGNIAEELE